ncbi:hypothetical protein JOD02_001417 [Caldicoprobacter guelmensis]|nr:hypothetical protein [Caldicoprobacter guelmensis]
MVAVKKAVKKEYKWICGKINGHFLRIENKCMKGDEHEFTGLVAGGKTS